MRPRAIDGPDEGATDLGALEGRGAARHAIASLAWFRTIEMPGEGRREAVEGDARSVDISRGGLGLVTSQSVPKGALLFLEVTLRRTGVSGARAQSSLHCVARVMHCSDAGDGAYRVGIRIELVPPGERALMEWLLGP